MVFDASNKIAVKCAKCGEYNIVDVDIFNLKETMEAKCRCGENMFKVKRIKKDLVFDINCIACENIHRFKFRLLDLMTKPLNIIICPISGMEIAFVGKDKNVKDIMAQYNNDILELLKALGIM
ncbi:MAG: hypothetical protein N2448_02140 [Caloramator sp.]|nr:hypothetical protein [Caloramator sp.]